MSNQYFNFYYDPVRQGYDSDTWNTILGVPVVVENQLELDEAGIIHYADILRGEATFNISMSAPTAGDDVKFGFSDNGGDTYAYFKVTDDELVATTSDGKTVETEAITWDATWSNTNVEFKIKWEAGKVTFSIGGQVVSNITDGTELDLPISMVPNIPMSIYLYNDSNDPLYLKYIDVKGVQNLV